MWMKLLIVVLLFFIIANPSLFKITRGLGGWVASPEGLPKTGGLILHGIVFAVVTRIVMRALWRQKLRRYYSQYEDEKYEDEKYEDEKYGEPESYDEFKDETD
jgi:hypothetical protein